MPSPKKTMDRPPFRGGREALLEATIRVVARDGFDGLTYRAVGEESGTTHGLVSYHFGSREALIHEAALNASRRAAESTSLDPVGDDVNVFLHELAEAVERDMDVHLFQYEMTLQGRRRPKLGEQMRELYQEYYRITEGALKRMGIDATPSLARMVFAAVDGIVLQQIVNQDSSATDAAVDALRDVLKLLAAGSERTSQDRSGQDA